MTDDDAPAVTNDRIDKLVAASELQSKTSEDLALAAVEYQERARLARKRFRVTLVLILLGFTGLYIRQESTNHAARDARHTLIDCVVPTGQCFKEGQARLAGTVGNLNRVTILAAACAPSYVDLPLPDRITAIQHCIERGLK